VLERFLSLLPESFVLLDLKEKARLKGFGPYVVVCLQETERMNILTETMKKTLQDL